MFPFSRVTQQEQRRRLVRQTFLLLADILARGSWSSGSIWQRFHNKQITNEDDVYQKIVFGLHKIALLTEDGGLGSSLIGVAKGCICWTEILWIKIPKLHQGAKRLQRNVDFVKNRKQI